MIARFAARQRGLVATLFPAYAPYLSARGRATAAAAVGRGVVAQG